MKITKKIVSFGLLLALGINNMQIFSMENNQNNENNSEERIISNDNTSSNERSPEEDQIFWGELQASAIEMMKSNDDLHFKEVIKKDENQNQEEEIVIKKEMQLSQEEIEKQNRANALGEKLVIACHNNNFELAEQLIKDGADINYTYDMNDKQIKGDVFVEEEQIFSEESVYSGMDHAIENKNVAIIKLLIDAGFHLPVNKDVLSDALVEVIIANNKDLMRLFQKMNAPIDDIVLKAVFAGSEELQKAFFEGNINVTQNEIDDFARGINNGNTPNYYLIQKYIDFDKEIEFLKAGNIKPNEKSMKKYIVKNVSKEQDKIDVFLYKLGCATGMIPTNYKDKFSLFSNDDIKAFFTRLKKQPRLKKQDKYTKSFFEKQKVEGETPVSCSFPLLIASALGNNKIISAFGDVHNLFSKIEVDLCLEAIMSLSGIFPGDSSSVSGFKHSGINKVTSLFDKAFQAAIVNNQLDAAKVLIASCGDITDKEIFAVIQNSIDSLSKMKQESKRFYDNKILGLYNSNKITDLQIKRDQEVLNLEEMQYELKCYLCNLCSFVKALQSKGIPAEIGMKIARYAHSDVVRLPHAQEKNKKQQILVTDDFDVVKFSQKTKQTLITNFFKSKKN